MTHILCFVSPLLCMFIKVGAAGDVGSHCVVHCNVLEVRDTKLLAHGLCLGYGVDSVIGCILEMVQVDPGLQFTHA